jgi:hypothetical protein
MKKVQEEEKEDLMGNSSMRGGYNFVDLEKNGPAKLALIVTLARIKVRQDTTTKHAVTALPEPGVQQLVYNLMLAQALALLVSSLLLDRQHALI